MCKRFKAKIIFASTYVYGKPLYVPIDEKHPISLWNPYATSKIIGEQLCSAYSQDFGIDAFILRIFNIYGYGQNSKFLMPTIVDGILSSNCVLQDSSPKRDFVYISDVVEAIVLCAESQRKGINIYNVATGKSHSVDEVVQLTKKILNSNHNVIYENRRRNAEVDNIIADITKIKEELRWHPKFDLESGIRCILSYYKGACHEK
jgi:UDP-glucose 4-epimerase